jgi:hypothetical protein
LGVLEALHDRYREEVAFFVIYIKEAHPEDGWVLETNRNEKIAVRDPATVEQRASVAGACALRLKMRLPVLLDAPDNLVASQYGGWPDRLYLIAKDGRVAFQGGEGPFEFKPDLLEHAIEKELRADRLRP